MKQVERLIAMRTGGSTERCHGIRHHGSYSVGEHSWGVAVLMYVLWPQDFQRLAIYCIAHDVPEAWVGDIPTTTKRYCPGVKQEVARLESAIFERLGLPDDGLLDEDDRTKLRACDRLELYLWALEQVHGGNAHADCVRRELERLFEETPLPAEAHALYEEIKISSVEHATDGLIWELTSGAG